ncbi:MAG: hypothetical protein ACYS7Y_12000 [Planctomycetota bacterium]|jgi:hypothetical protein
MKTIYLLCHGENTTAMSRQYATTEEGIRDIAVDLYWGTLTNPNTGRLSVQVDMDLMVVSVHDTETSKCVSYRILAFRDEAREVEKLWKALDLPPSRSEDVFTTAARAIQEGNEIGRIVRTQQMHGPLIKVVLYPCDCGRYTIDEWYRVINIHKEQSAVEMADKDHARALYRRIFGRLRESHYIFNRDTYTSHDERDNFIVTGSHHFCKKCQS